jgi:hypothetical protein
VKLICNQWSDLSQCVHVYLQADPAHPQIYTRGQVAQAEPTVPGWRLPVDELFE